MENYNIPVKPTEWAVAEVGDYGLIITLDGFQIKLADEELMEFFDLVEAGEAGLVQTVSGYWVQVHPDADEGIVVLSFLSKSEYVNHTFPDGVVLDAEILSAIGIEIDEEIDEDEVMEGVKMAYKRSGKKMKRGFRVTSGIRKGRVVTNIKTAHKPKAKASTRTKLRLARKKKKSIRILKSKRTRKKSLSKRVARMNAARK